MMDGIEKGIIVGLIASILIWFIGATINSFLAGLWLAPVLMFGLAAFIAVCSRRTNT